MPIIDCLFSIPTKSALGGCFFFSSSESKQIRKLKTQIIYSATLDEYKQLNRQLDKCEGKLNWIMSDFSAEYDYKLIRNRLTHLKNVEESDGISSMMFILRAGLIRNLGGIGKNSLYSHCHVGTKKLIEEYVEEVVHQIGRVAWTQEPEITTSMKIDFFSDVLQSFGRTALIFHGGASFGLSHLGVAKALFDAKMLPKVICGSYIGALMAGLICSKSADELTEIFLGNIDISSFDRHNPEGSFKRKIVRLLQHGRLLDIGVISECAKDNIGDITFREAFLKTGRVLNIIVHAKRKHEVPVLLNYLTAPDVVIWSAASASCAVLGIYDAATLLAKDSKGQTVSWNPSAVLLSSAKIMNEIPVSRLSELFNVNNFIVSHVPSYFSMRPASSLDGSTRLLSSVIKWIFLEFGHRFNQLKQLGLIPSSVRRLEEIFSSPHVGDIQLTPTIYFSDFKYLFSNPTPQFIRYCIFKGQEACWQNITQIEMKCSIEFELERMIQALKAHRNSTKPHK